MADGVDVIWSRLGAELIRRLLGRGGVASLLGLVCGCTAPSPPSQMDQLEVTAPESWQADAEAVLTEFSAGWLEDFDDPRLTRLVVEAVEENYDLEAAAARVDAFQASSRIAGADRLPQIGAGASASRNWQSTRQGGRQVESREDRFGLSLDLAWELDVWGRLRDRASAAVADFEASEADYRAARLSLAAQTAQAWFDVVEARRQVELARETVESFQQNLEFIQERYRRGLAEALDLHLIRASVGDARNRLESRQRQLDAAIRSLEVLIGRYPARELEVASGIELPTPSMKVPAGLPSQLLERRPDLQAAERRLAAASRRVRESQKSLLPQFRLTAGGGTLAPELSRVSDTDFGFWELAGNLSQPLFEGGRLLANIDRTEAEKEEAVAAYAQTALEAFREVEAALAAEGYLADEQEALRQTVESSVAAEELAWEQYQSGVLDDVIPVLESQRRSFEAQRQLLQISNERIQNRLDLYLALGGDFKEVSDSDGGLEGDLASEEAEAL